MPLAAPQPQALAPPATKSLRILILGLNYLPETTAIGPYTADLAEHLNAHGHQVQVITGFPSWPQLKVWEPYAGKLFMRDSINGVAVRRTYLYMPKQPGRARNRILLDCSFALSALLGALGAGGCDIVVAVSPPLQLGLTAAVLARMRGAKLLLQLKDLVPDVAIGAGFLDEHSRAVRWARRLEKYTYRCADRIGVICEGFRQNLIGKGVRAEKIELLPDSLDLTFMRPHPRDNAFRQRHQIAPGQFLVMYSGGIALKQGLEVFIEAAARLRDQPDIVLLLVGEGPYSATLSRHAARLGLANFRFLPLQPHAGLPLQLAAADALVVTQRKGVADCVFPGKLLYYMAAGRPIIAAVPKQSETGRFINQEQVGLVVTPEDPSAMAAGIRRLRDDRAAATALGRNGRQVAEARFDRLKTLARFERVLAEMAG